MQIDRHRNTERSTHQPIYLLPCNSTIDNDDGVQVSDGSWLDSGYTTRVWYQLTMPSDLPVKILVTESVIGGWESAHGIQR